MNDRVYSVLFKLCILYIVASFVLQFWFPEVFMIRVESETINSLFANSTFALIYDLTVSNAMMFLTLYLYFGACFRIRKLEKIHLLSIFIIIVVTNVIQYTIGYPNAFYHHVYMLIVPIWLKSNAKQVVKVLATYSILQISIIAIRSLVPQEVMLSYFYKFVITLDNYPILLLIWVLNQKGDFLLWEKKCLHGLEKKSTNRNHLLQKLKEKLSKKMKDTKKQWINIMRLSILLFQDFKSWSQERFKLNWKHIKKQEYSDIYFKATQINALKIATSNLGQHILAFSTIFSSAYLLDKRLEALFIVIAHFVIRPSMDKQYHCTTTMRCIAVTTSVIIMYFVSTLPFRLSILSSLVVVTFISWIGYVIADRIDLKQENEEMVLINNELQALKDSLEKFDPTNCTETELLQKCKQKGLNKKDTDNAIVCFLKGFSGKELADHFGITENSAFRKKSELKSKLTS